MIALWYIGYRNPNGGITFTEHLVRVLQDVVGEEVKIFRVKKRAMKSQPISKFGGMEITTVTLDEAKDICTENPSMLVNFLQRGDELEYAYALTKVAYCPVVFHDPRSFIDPFVDWLHNNAQTVVFIREALLKAYKKKYHLNNGVFLPHPYVREYHSFAKTAPGYHAIAIGRIAREKRTEIIAEANEILDDYHAIKIFGTISDRLYEFGTLRKKFPNWQKHFMSEPQTHGMSTAQVCRRSTYAVDMSQFGKDGGGSQYTFLEAMDAGAALVINSDWLNYPGEMKIGVNCLAVSSAKELVKVVKMEPLDMNEGYEETLHFHSSAELAEDWVAVLEG